MTRRGTGGLLALFVLLSAVPFAPSAGGQPSSWTFMVYLDADNNLEDVGVDDFLEMASVGSTADVNIVVQFDRSNNSNPSSGGDTRYGDWTTAKRFLVQKGMDPTTSNQIVDVGEVNMANPDTLVNFVVWAMTSYPADHYFLDLWDHGIGWPGVIIDSGGAILKTTELAGALQTISDTVGERIDIIGNDACRMTVEIDYEVRQFADYFVGSEKDEPLAGWPYDTFLASLVANPSMSPRDLGTTLADAYVESYRDNSPYSVALSVIEAASLPDLAAATSVFVEELNASLPYFQEELLTARSLTESYEGGVEFDLYDLAKEVHSAVPSRRVKEAASGLMSAVLRAAVYEAHWDNPSPVNGYRALDTNGLSVWFPVEFNNPSYLDLGWAADTDWAGFLQSYREGTSSDVPITTILALTDSDQDGNPDGLDMMVNGVPGGTYAVDAYRENLLIASRNASAGVGMHIDLPQGSVVDLYLYAADAGGVLVNYTVIENALQVPFIVSGYVRSDLGDAIPGAVVTLVNNQTGESYTGTADQNGRYSVSIPGGEYAAGDSVTLSSSVDGAESAVSIALPDGLIALDVDLIIGGPGSASPDGVPMAWAVVLLGVEAATLVGALLIALRRRRPA